MSEFLFFTGKKEYAVSISKVDSTTWSAKIGDKEILISLGSKQSNHFDVQINGIGHHVQVDTNGDERIVSWRGNSYNLERIDNQNSSHSHHAGAGAIDPHIRAPMPGKVIKVHCSIGETVEEKTPLVVLEAMKMEYVLCAPRAGLIESLNCKQGDQVELSDVLVKLKSEEAVIPVGE